MRENEINELANKKAEIYAQYVMETDLDRACQYADIDYANGFVEGYKEGQPYWMEVTESTKNLNKGFYAIRICREDIINIRTEYISNGCIDYFYATHYCKIILPQPIQS